MLGDGEGGLEPDWERKHRDFHSVLVRACDSPRLMTLRDQLNDLSDRYRHMSVASGVKGRNPATEHKAIMTAVLARDANKASELVAEHFLETTKFVLIGTGTSPKVAAAITETLRKNLLC
jgi:DNA-binding GntR family transcriptional regulator